MTDTPESPSRSWRDSLLIYLHPRVASMAFLGFSAGLPYMLVFSTLTAWLTEAGVTKASIGFFSWIGITYSVKVFWAPVVDRFQLPLLGRLLGRRRSWMLFAQLLIAGGLIGMSVTDPVGELEWIAIFALVVAFGSATQDVAIDAWRIEAVSLERQAAMSATYVFSYRLAVLMASAGALHMVSFATWPGVYLIMALLMGVGMVTVLLSSEPTVTGHSDAAFLEQRAQDYLERSAHVARPVRNAVAWFIGAVVCPFVDFLQRYGAQAVLLLLIVGAFRITDISMASMAMPFYLETGYTRADVANISGLYGAAMTVLGGIVGGVLVPRFGLLRVLLAGAVLAAATNLLYSINALVGAELWMLVLTISGENFCGGLAMASLIAWMSSLVSSDYTATQYALFSSLMTLPGKVIGGFSGIVVEQVGFFWFFIYAGGLGVPAILLVLWLMLRTRTGSL
ncbi:MULTISPECIES: AmpG family muropeptide MFS transporter [Marinimicrobium]|jgi:PAT family beta-lactamase induction signal transducer AmpG|uniref:PAT family beta-lactamase induction signal transducer AmpG n=2 Tax=Marinimicrobium TaxID=359337 RepID=A0A3N1NW80_9GAMM|nr:MULTISPECIES: MFS transporter [Marinimicrobium]MAN52792.1 AmpG family muropeptide MFS transporter [Marinimicrobium sp.]ROQ19508.1 PAT family beta-lactamase induction signal transducer AmpG [Marinimicrobium koreense]